MSHIPNIIEEVIKFRFPGLALSVIYRGSYTELFLQNKRGGKIKIKQYLTSKPLGRSGNVRIIASEPRINESAMILNNSSITYIAKSYSKNM